MTSLTNELRNKLVTIEHLEKLYFNIAFQIKTKQTATDNFGWVMLFSGVIKLCYQVMLTSDPI